MTYVRCPLCDAVVTGEGEMAVSGSLRDHLADLHGFTDLCETPSLAVAGPELGEDVGASVLCPFCGLRLLGRDGGELSYGLHHHVEDVHGLRSTRLSHWLRY